MTNAQKGGDGMAHKRGKLARKTRMTTSENEMGKARTRPIEWVENGKEEKDILYRERIRPEREHLDKTVGEQQSGRRKKAKRKQRQTTKMTARTEAAGSIRSEGGDIPEWASQDDIEYAEETTVLIENDIRGQMCERMGEYCIIEETGELETKRGNASLLTGTRPKPEAKLPPHFDRIKYTQGGKA